MRSASTPKILLTCALLTALAAPAFAVTHGLPGRGIATVSTPGASGAIAQAWSHWLDWLLPSKLSRPSASAFNPTPSTGPIRRPAEGCGLDPSGSCSSPH
jgi:hypothetical protein